MKRFLFLTTLLSVLFVIFIVIHKFLKKSQWIVIFVLQN